MTIVADESIDRPIVEALRRDGHEVTDIAECSPGITDDRVLHEANTRQALLLTADKDFGELIYRQKLVHTGVVLIRLSGLTAESKARIVATMFATHGVEFWDGFCVITPTLLRIRH